MKPRKTKPEHTSFLIRNVPNQLHREMQALAHARGLTLKAFMLETCRREVENAKQS